MTQEKQDTTFLSQLTVEPVTKKTGPNLLLFLVTRVHVEIAGVCITGSAALISGKAKLMIKIRGQ